MTSIKRKYKERLVNLEKQWPPCHSNKLVKLELVERGKGTKTVIKRVSMEYSDLFAVSENQRKKVRKILVEGDAGVGKTTLCTALSEGWAGGEILQQFELLLYLPLRHKESASADSFSDLVKPLHSSASVCEAVISYIEEDEGEKVLIVADGWDEFKVDKRQEDSFLYGLLSGKKFPFVSILLTSRPSASATLHDLKSIDQSLEVVGFSKENIERFIRSELSGDGEAKVCSLLEQLESNPLVESVCSVPLNCAILCHLWRTLEEALPSTMTELYRMITLNVVLRSIRKIDAYSNLLGLSSYDDLPKGLQQSWWLLCKFAFQALEKKQLVFSHTELESCFPKDLPKALIFGLLQSSTLVHETGCGISYNFLHRTIQEYLAALHLVRQTPVVQNKVLELHALDSDFSYMALRFYFGIQFSRNPENTDVDMMMHYVCGMHKCYSGLENWDPADFPQPLHLSHFAYEARNMVITDKIVQYLIKNNVCFSDWLNIFVEDTKSFSLHDHPRSAHDCAAILYVISNMQPHECQRMVIDFSNSSVRVGQLKTLANELASRHGKLRITSFGLHGCKLRDESAVNLFNTASLAFNLVELDLSDNLLGDNSITAITTALEKSPSNSLSTLILSHNHLSVSSLRTLEGAVRSELLENLKQLHLHGSFKLRISAVASLPGFKEETQGVFNSFLEALSNHCPKLEVLDLSDNYFQVSLRGAVALAKLASRSENLKLNLQPRLFNLSKCPYETDGREINLNATNLGDDGLIAFIENLEGPCRFYSLGLMFNNISATGVSSLAEAICNGKVTISDGLDVDTEPDYLDGFDTVGLHLSYNSLGIKGTEAIYKMLESSNCWFSILSLEGCQLSNAGNYQVERCIQVIGERPCQMSPYYSITHLSLSENSFTGNCIDILFRFMHLCPNLTVLSCRQCEITSDDLKQLLIKLNKVKKPSPQHQFPYLISWDLRNNKIDDRGVSALLDYLPSLAPLSALPCTIELENNPASNEMVSKLNQQLQEVNNIM